MKNFSQAMELLRGLGQITRDSLPARATAAKSPLPPASETGAEDPAPSLEPAPNYVTTRPEYQAALSNSDLVRALLKLQAAPPEPSTPPQAERAPPPESASGQPPFHASTFQTPSIPAVEALPKDPTSNPASNWRSRKPLAPTQTVLRASVSSQKDKTSR